MPAKKHIQVKVNRLFDVCERTFWTFTNTFLGLLTVSSLDNGINLSTVHKLEGAAIAALYTIIKTTAAQRVGDSGMGDAIVGGDVLEPTQP